ncbi:MAG: glycosyltransferase [Actinobacteria bacterium]|nr:glycosyltransferase [Actinomycetota bacterium]
MNVIQLCARLEFGDAVSNHVLEINRELASRGCSTSIFANTLDEFGSQVARPDTCFPTADFSTGDVLIFHYSLYCENYRKYLEFPGKRVLIYHNITPPEYFAAYDKGVAEFCRLGRELLPQLKECDLALGDSEYNRLELVEMGFEPEKTGVLPIFIDYESMKKKAASSGPVSGYKKSFNVLFVGRAVPNKRIEDLLRAFFCYNRCINSNSNLFLIGPSWVDRYDAQLRWLLDSLGLWQNVHFTGRISDEDLAASYRDADVFLSMSEHEGFAVPLVESMAFDLPLLAYSSTAIPHTLSGAGISFSSKEFKHVAELMELLRTDPGLRNKIIEGQRKRLGYFSKESVAELLKNYLDRVTEGTA